MIKKLLFLPLLGLSLVLLVQCSDDPVYSEAEDQVTMSAKKGPNGGGNHEETAGNNLSFPVIAVDGFGISPVTNSFTVPYTGAYTGLTDEEIAELESSGPWYPQKTEGNVWQAGYINNGSEDVTYIDWGDNIESVYPKIRTPFRLEVTLYKTLVTPMSVYTMAVLEYPSSSSELQGTNTNTDDSYFATIISTKPKLVIQYLGTSKPTDLTWSVYQWTSSSPLFPVDVTFLPELNVGGKYIYGASSGGWKPTSLGYYRITFYIPTSSGIDFTSTTTVANFSDGFTGTGEGTAATPIVDDVNNLTYVDVEVKTGGGKSRRF